MSSYNRPFNLLIAADAADPITGVTVATIPDGEITILKENMTVMTAADSITESDIIYLAQGQANGTAKILSAPIKGAYVQSYKGKTFEAGVQKVQSIGYNGTDGSINIPAAPDGVDFDINIVYNHIKEELAHRQWRRDFSIEGAVGETQESLAAQFMNLINSDEVLKLSNSEIHEYAFAFRLYSGGFTASDNIVTVVNGSPDITFTTAAEHSTGTPYAIGDIIRIGQAGSGGATTDPAYVITDVNGLVLTLDADFVGASGAIPAVDSGILAAGGDWGINIEGESERVFFEVGLEGGFNSGGTTANRELQAVDFGSGTVALLTQMETLSKGYRGHTNRRLFPVPSVENETDLVTGGQYDVIVIEHDSIHNTENQETAGRRLLKTMVAIPTSNSFYGTFITNLDTWMSSTPKAFDVSGL